MDPLTMLAFAEFVLDLVGPLKGPQKDLADRYLAMFRRAAQRPEGGITEAEREQLRADSAALLNETRALIAARDNQAPSPK